jgi:uncharacterized protein YyaL (SSP411 family)
MLGDGLLTLYETTFDVRWWREAMRLGGEIIRLFADESGGGFYDTGKDASQTVVRPKDLFDNAVPAGNSAASDLLLRLSALSGERDLEDAATGFLRLIAPAVEQAPGGFGNALCAIDRETGGSLEIAIIGSDSRALLETAWEPYVPNRVLAASDAPSDQPPLLKHRTSLEGTPTAYVCRNFVCELPVTDVAALTERLLASPGGR